MVTQARPTGTSAARSENYRYLVDNELSHLTPLAAVEASIGNQSLRVLNISMGGLAMIFAEAPQMQVGDVLDISIAIRERPFPMQIEIKALKGLRVSAAFIDPSPLFHSALREFLAPKFLGASLKPNSNVQNLPQALELVEGATAYEAYVGQNQTGALIWMGANRRLLRLIAVSRELVLGWESKEGLRTGRLQPRNESADESLSKDNVTWDRVPEVTLSYYLADILLAWLPSEEGRSLIEKLLSQDPTSLEKEKLQFPRIS